MKSMNLISIIGPVYNVENYIRECLDSILAQTCREFELVVVDDKSPDVLYEVFKEYPWEPSFETLPDGGRRWLIDGVPVRYYQNAENIGGKENVIQALHCATRLRFTLKDDSKADTETIKKLKCKHHKVHTGNQSERIKYKLVVKKIQTNPIYIKVYYNNM